MTRHIVVMGMMGAGKTTVGRALAQRLHLQYNDNDDALRARSGVDAATYAAQHGVAALHQMEHDLLATAVSRADDSVVGAPGSVALDTRAGELLAGQDVVWLRARLDTLLRRVTHDPARPLLSGDIATGLHVLMIERDPGFERLATCIVDVDDAPLEDIVDTIVTRLHRG